MKSSASKTTMTHRPSEKKKGKKGGRREREVKRGLFDPVTCTPRLALTPRRSFQYFIRKGKKKKERKKGREPKKRDRRTGW